MTKVKVELYSPVRDYKQKPTYEWQQVFSKAVHGCSIEWKTTLIISTIPRKETTWSKKLSDTDTRVFIPGQQSLDYVRQRYTCSTVRLSPPLRCMLPSRRSLASQHVAVCPSAIWEQMDHSLCSTLQQQPTEERDSCQTRHKTYCACCLTCVRKLKLVFVNNWYELLTLLLWYCRFQTALTRRGYEICHSAYLCFADREILLPWRCDQRTCCQSTYIQ